MKGPLVRTLRHVTYAAATDVVHAGTELAGQKGMSVTVCITDISGGIVAVGRMEGAHDRTVDLARGKATYSAASGKTTAWFVENRLEQNEVLWKALSEDPGTFLVPGGVPLLYEGQAVGAVGVSGAAYHEDTVIAEACGAHWDALVDADGEGRGQAT